MLLWVKPFEKWLLRIVAIILFPLFGVHYILYLTTPIKGSKFTWPFCVGVRSRLKTFIFILLKWLLKARYSSSLLLTTSYHWFWSFLRSLIFINLIDKSNKHINGTTLPLGLNFKSFKAITKNHYKTNEIKTNKE